MKNIKLSSLIVDSKFDVWFSFSLFMFGPAARFQPNLTSDLRLISLPGRYHMYQIGYPACAGVLFLGTYEKKNFTSPGDEAMTQQPILLTQAT